MEYIQDIFSFIWKVFNNWAGYATGGVTIAIIWLWSIIKQKSLSKRGGIALAVIFLFFAFFTAWHDEHKEKLKLIDEKSKIGLRRDFYFKNADFKFDVNKDGSTELTISLIFENKGQDILSYELTEASLGIDANFTSGATVPVYNSKSYIEPKGEKTFHYTTNLMPLNLSNPVSMTIGFTAKYDNIPPVHERFTTRRIKYEFTSLNPPLYKVNTILFQDER